MKKIITILTLLCSFGLKAGAQQFLSREAYRDKVEAYSQVLKQQRLKTMASTEARKIANTGFLPQIDITAEGTANLNHLDKWNSPKGEYRPYTYQALATLAQPLYTGGSLIAQKRMAQADEELSQLTTELTLDQIHYQSDAVYWNASAAYASLEAAATFQDIIKKQHDIIQDRFNDGAISRTDLLMISTRQKEAELQYIKARQNYTLALQQLNILMGVAPNTPVDSLSEISIASEPVDILGLDDVLPRRADYASTTVNIARSEAQRHAALSKYNPQVSMFLATGWDTGITYMGQEIPHTPVAGVNVSIPIFRWGARFKTNRQQKAFIGIQKLQQSYITDNILEELSAATTKLTETEQQVKTAKENMALAEENLDLVTFSYNEGKSSMADVLSAQLSWTQAHTNLINAHLAEKQKDLSDYKAETLKVIRGQSNLSVELLNALVKETETMIALAQTRIDAAQTEYESLLASAENLRQEYDRLLTWADLFDTCSFEAKKMIVAQFVKAVRVSRDYNIEIDFNVSFEEFQNFSVKNGEPVILQPLRSHTA